MLLVEFAELGQAENKRMEMAKHQAFTLSALKSLPDSWELLASIIDTQDSRYTCICFESFCQSIIDRALKSHDIK